MPTKIKNLLVANRGEIAIRVMRGARALGMRTVAVYSEADADAPHVAFADQAVAIGKAPASESYLNIERVIDAARRAGADAIHPGYGLLSENAAFARACLTAGLTFVGPRPETIELMGNKRQARIAMAQAGVPCVPGYDGEDQSDATLAEQAERVGFPLMVKAAAGGGGRGIRRVMVRGELQEAVTRARSESEKAFGDGRLILERLVTGARHVEIQVLADAYGHAIHLGERDCSVQRRFQKVIEEAPSPAVDAELRKQMGAIALRVAERSSYLGAGTVELLLEPGIGFYFLEMNTRLQVEHPVTELVTGIDLVAWQLRIAEGERLSLSQSDVTLTGHAIEARLYAEDPSRGFTPATGRVVGLQLPEASIARMDHCLSEGLVISPHYDPMLGKLIAHGQDREQARRRLCAALDRLRVLGVTTNQAWLRCLLDHDAFISGGITTDFLDQQSLASQVTPPSLELLAAAALVHVSRRPSLAAYSDELENFSNCEALAWPLVLDVGAERVALSVARKGPREFLVRRGAEHLEVELVRASAIELIASLGCVQRRFDCAWDGAWVFIHTPEGTRSFRDVTHTLQAAADGPGEGRALAPMDGAVVELKVVAGDRVRKGQTVAVLEAMKLQLQVTSDVAGVVSAVHVRRGAQVKARQLLVEVASDESG